jgi:diacylglycerol kinase family enzyme
MTAAGQDAVNTGWRTRHAVPDGHHVLAAAEPLLVFVVVQTHLPLVAATAALDDGLLHGYSLEVRHWWQLLALAPALRHGRYEAWRAVRSFACRELEVRTRRPRPVNADGEIITTTPARFRVHPRAVRVYAPGMTRG